MIPLWFHFQGRNIVTAKALVTSVFQVLLEEQIRNGSAQCVLFGHHSEICDASVTLHMKSCTQVYPPSSPNITLLLLVIFSYLTMLERHYVISSIITSAKNPFGIHHMSCQNQSVLLDLKSTTYKGWPLAE